VLLIAEILAKVWFIDRAARAFMKGTFEVIAEKMGSGGAYMDLSLEALDAVEYFGTTEYAKIGCIMAAQTAFFAGLIYFLPKILKNNELNIAPDAALSTVAFAALPSAAATLASALLLSVLSYNSLSVYAMFAVCGAGLMASIALLDAGMKKYIQNDKTRLILLTIGYGVQLAVVLFALFSFMPACITDAIYNLMYNR
jgi:hypothetical protein